MQRRGFTLIELLTVIGIIMFLSTIAMPSIAAMRRNVAFNSTVREIVSDLRTEQNRAISSQDGINHGVHFSADRYDLYGGSWASPTYTEEHVLDTGVSINFGATPDMNFSRLVGTPSSAGIITIDYGGQSRSIRVEADGRIMIL